MGLPGRVEGGEDPQCPRQGAEVAGPPVLRGAGRQRRGLVKPIAECSRDGRFIRSREVRVVPGGCTTGPEKGGRDRLGNLSLRLPGSLRAGEIIEVRTKVDHNSHTGLALKDGRFVRVAPEF